MTYGKSRNVIVINNLHSDYVEQAILILKKSPASKEYFGSQEDIVVEAQHIIDSYLQTEQQKNKKLGKNILGTISISLLSVFGTIGLILSLIHLF